MLADIFNKYRLFEYLTAPILNLMALSRESVNVGFNYTVNENRLDRPCVRAI